VTNRVITFLIATIFSSSLLAASAPLSPLRRFQGLVAGVPEMGSRDGSFTEARFSSPFGILFDESRYSLIVADSKTGQIRQIHLKEANRVTTLLQTEQGLQSPTTIEWLQEPSKILVLDQGKNNIAMVDLQTKSPVWILPVPLSPGARLGDIGAMTFAGNATSGTVVIALKNSAKVALLRPTEADATPQWLSLSGTAERMNIIDMQLYYNGLRLIIESPAGRRMEQWSLPGKPNIPWASYESVVPLTQKPWVRAIVDTGAALTPTAFVRQSPIHSRILNTQNPLGATLTIQGGIFEQWPIDEAGRKLPAEAAKLYHYSNDPLLEEPQQRGKSFFRDLKAASFDEKTMTWYMSDTKNHRILSFRELNVPALRNVPNGLGSVAYPTARHPNSKRIWLSGSSNTFYSGDGPWRLFDGYAFRLERHLNLMASLKGLDTDYEVMMVGGPANFTPIGYSQTGQLILRIRKQFEKELPDIVLVCVNPDEIHLAAADFGKRPLDEQGLPFTSFDPESLDDPARIKTLSSDYQALVRHLEGAPQLFKSLYVGKGKLLQFRPGDSARIFGTELRENKSFDLTAVFIKKYFKEIDRALREESARAKVAAPKVYLVSLPMQFMMEQEERYRDIPGESNTDHASSLFATSAQELGWGYIDTLPPIRSWNATYPYTFNDNRHPTKNAYDLFSFITAHRMLEAPKQ
jgi:hypothetical protein